MRYRKSNCLMAGVLSIVAAGLFSDRAAAQKAIYIVRHAEKEMTGNDPPLTPAGVKRSQAPSDLLKHANIKAIYTGSALRTKQTALPLASALAITPEEILDGDATKTFESALHKHWNEAVLIVGHSDTLDALLKKWASDASVQINDNDFSTLLIVTPEAPGKAGWTRLRYEAP